MEWGGKDHLREFLDEDANIPKVEVDDWLLFIWRGYQRLSSDRPWHSGGMGPMMPGAIPWSVIKDWCAYHQYTRDQSELFEYGCRVMDGVFIEHWQAKNASKK